MKDNISEKLILDQIFEYAEKLGKSNNAGLSAESFLLAIVDVMLGNFEPEYTEKSQRDAINCLSAFLEYYMISYTFTKERLQRHIDTIENASVIDNDFIIILNKAEKASIQYGNKYVSPEFVLDAILKNPTTEIKKCLYSARKTESRRLNINEYMVFRHLRDQSKTACGKKDSGFTAEKFLWTVCDALENGFKTEDDSPSNNIKKLFVKRLNNVFDFYRVSPDILKFVLTAHFDNNMESPDDAAIMDDVIKAVSKETRENGVAYITAELVLDYLLDSPYPRHQILIQQHNQIKRDDLEDEDFNDYLFEEDDENDSMEEYQSDIIFDDELDEIFEKPQSDEDNQAVGISEEEKIKKQNKLFKNQLNNSVVFSKSVQNHLSNIVFGQDNAIKTFVSAYYQAMVRKLTGVATRKPYATFLFAGPPGVGKTFLAESIAQELHLPFRRFDMSEYCEKESNLAFCGSNKVYKNGSRGNFTSFVADNPECVVLFDEIEKSHSVIINLFLQMLDAGIIRDNFTEEEVSLENVIMIFTTNAGKQLYKDSESSDFSATSRKVIIKALQEDINPQTGTPYFPAAICSRFASGNVVMFNHITPHNLLNIAKREIESSALSFQQKSGINIEIDERVYAAILFAEGGNADARTIKNRANTIFNNELYEFFRLIITIPFDKNVETLNSIKICVELPENQPEITELFEHTDKFKALVFSSKHTVNSVARKTSACDFLCARTIEEANEIMRKNDISIVLIDLNHGASKDDDFLNIGDEDSVARDFLIELRQENSSVPVYLLQTKKHTFTPEEKRTFASQGVRGVIDIANPDLDIVMGEICQNIHEQQSIIGLAKANKVVSYETAQRLSDDKKSAEIVLFDFKLETAVEAKDSSNILSNVSKPDVKFDDVIGAEDAKEELAYFVEYLKNPKKYIGTGVKVPKGVLLYGPPGTGKTMLAKAMAGESDITFICAEGNQFLKSNVGGGSQAIHDLFCTARKYAPAILFIDEIDAIAKERTGFGNSEDTLTALLTEMDGFKNQTAKPVFVLAATNFDVVAGGAKSLDPALMRRFDRRIYIDLPNRDDRIKFMRIKINLNSAYDISNEMVENLAIRSTGMSLADLDSVFELSLRMVIRNKKTAVTDDILDEAFETFNSGEKKNWNSDTLLRVARHEAGHAVMCYEGGETPSYLTVVPRGDHGGYMQHSTDEDKRIFTKNELLAKIRTSLGGRAAEIVYYGAENGVSTGATGDLLNATSIARQMVELYGMDDSLGLVSFANPNEMSAETKTAVNKILANEMNNAIEIIKANKKSVDALSEALINKNHLSGNEISKMLKISKKEEL